MKLHTNTLTSQDVRNALATAKEDGHITRDIEFVVFNSAGSRSHKRAFELQLGTPDKYSGPTNSRHHKNSGVAGASHIYAATYAEWGWLIDALFDLDESLVFGPYKSRQDFDTQTRDAFVKVTA